MPEMAMVFLRLDRRIGSLLDRVLERNRPKEYPQVESERERRAADSLGEVAVERLVVDNVDLLGRMPPGSLWTELREPLPPQKRPDFLLNLPPHNFAVHKFCPLEQHSDVRTLIGRIRQLQAERHDKHIRSVAVPRKQRRRVGPRVHALPRNRLSPLSYPFPEQLRFE